MRTSRSPSNAILDQKTFAFRILALVLVAGFGCGRRNAESSSDTRGPSTWKRQLGSAEDDEARAVAVEASGNAFMVGITKGGMEGANVGSFGTHDVFIAKYDETGALLWKRQIGSQSDDFALAVSSDSNGFVFMAGCTYGVIDEKQSAAGQSDLFLAKYDLLGDLVWKRQNSAVKQATGIAADATGSTLVVGGNGADAVILKYDPEGNVVWIRPFGTASGDTATGVVVDSGNNAYVVGTTPGALDGTNAGAVDAFLVMYSSSGELVWKRQFGTAQDDYAQGVSLDGGGNIYVAGYAHEIGGSGANHPFIAKYTSLGDGLWTKQLDTSQTLVWGVAVGSSGEPLIVGNTPGVSIEAGADAFISRFTPSGDLVSTAVFGASSANWEARDDSALGVSADSAGDVFVVGYTTGVLDAANYGGSDAFIAKFLP
jgi:hypothetical protein